MRPARRPQRPIAQSFALDNGESGPQGTLYGEVESDSPAGGEHLETAQPFSTIKDAISPATYSALVDRPMKLKTMTPVQEAVMNHMPGIATPNPSLCPDAEQAGRKDLLIQAKTGTGKTLAFLVPAIEQRIRSLEAVRQQAQIDNSGADKSVMERAVRSFARQNVGTIIVSPTRELATQIANEAIRAATNHPEFEVRLFVGGASKGLQMRDWMRGRRDIVVATPGRLLDLLQSEPEVAKGFEKTQLLILDEADTLLEMGFREDIERIRSYMPNAPERQTFLCSATLSPAIKQVAQGFLRPEHEFICTVSQNDSPVHAHVPQYHTVLQDAAEQIPHVLRLIAHDQLANAGKSKIIVFLTTTKFTQLSATVIQELARNNLPAVRTNVYELHSKRAQESRTRTSNSFRQDKTGASVLITSDVSARGVDYPGVTRVIQVGIPSSTEVYIHRVGRTGRAGTEGRGDLVLLPWEMGFVTHQLNGVPMKPLTANELKGQLAQLTSEYEADPVKFYTPPPPPSDKRYVPRGMEPVRFANDTNVRVEGISTAVEDLKARLDETAIGETFASMLGYYLAKSTELRCSKESILDGLKAWAMEAGGLPESPYVSKQMMAKLGMGETRPPRREFGFGRGAKGGGAPARSGHRGGRDHHSSGARSYDGGYESRSYDGGHGSRSYDRGQGSRSYDKGQSRDSNRGGRYWS